MERKMREEQKVNKIMASKVKNGRENVNKVLVMATSGVLLQVRV